MPDDLTRRAKMACRRRRRGLGISLTDRAQILRKSLLGFMDMQLRHTQEVHLEQEETDGRRTQNPMIQMNGHGVQFYQRQVLQAS